MRVSSPVGEFPYEISAARLRGSELVLDGRMGTWPSQVALSASDLLALARTLRTPLALTGAVGVALLAGARAARRGRLLVRPGSRRW